MDSFFGSDRQKIKKSYLWDDKEVDYIRFSNGLVDDFLLDSGNFVDIPINALRVIFNIISIVRNDQFRPEDRPKQLSLFEEEFEADNNVFAQITLKNNRVSPSGSTHQVVKAYEFLTKFKMEWHKSLNSKGEEIRTFGGLISNPTYNQRGCTTFLISRYWLRKIIVITEYNLILYKLVYNIKSNKHILFAFWLRKIPDGGTKLKLSTFNAKFGLNYTKSGDFCSKFLFEVRKSLDRFNDISFNYNYRNDLIHIVPYRTKKIEDDSVGNETKLQILSNQRLRYFKKRFNLNEDSFEKLKFEYSKFPRSRVLIEESYVEFVANCRAKNVKSVIFQNSLFLEQIQRILIQKYLETKIGKKFPNGYPVII